MLAAVEQDSLAIKYASEKLQQERTFVLAAVSANGFSIRHAHEKWQRDPFVVTIATKAMLTNSVHTCMRGTCSLVIFVLIIIMCLVLAGAFGVGI